MYAERSIWVHVVSHRRLDFVRGGEGQLSHDLGEVFCRDNVAISQDKHMIGGANVGGND